MRLKKYLMLFLVSASAFFLVGINQCAMGPKLKVYISNPNAHGLDFSDGDGSKGFLPYEKSDHFVCLSATDAETLLNYCGVNRQHGSNP